MNTKKRTRFISPFSDTGWWKLW